MRLRTMFILDVVIGLLNPRNVTYSGSRCDRCQTYLPRKGRVIIRKRRGLKRMWMVLPLSSSIFFEVTLTTYLVHC